MKKQIIFLISIFVCIVSFGQNKITSVQIDSLGKKFELVGELGEKLGNTMTVKGVIVDGPYKGYNDDLNLMVQMIDEKPTQVLIQIPVLPYFGAFGGSTLPKLEKGFTYRLRVYETGEFVGIPLEAYGEAQIALQTTRFYFQNKLVVISGEKIDSIEWSPNIFLGQNAIISGIAENENDTALIVNSKWKLRLNGVRKWTDSEVGKLVEVSGKIQETKIKNIYYVENCQPRLVRLEDQLGKIVKLRGTAKSINDYWWFNYRGIDIYVENMKDLPNWTGDNHFRPMEITGMLEQAELPRIEQLTLKTNPELKTYFIVRNASWTPIDGLLTPELDIQK